MFALARTSATELLYFEFGEPLDADLPLEERVRWIIADLDRRRAEFATLSITQVTGLLVDWLDEAGDDVEQLLPLIRALGFLRNTNTADFLQRYLSHPVIEVRQETILALGRIGERPRLTELEPSLESPIRSVRRAAIIALSKSLNDETFSMLDATAGTDAELQDLVRQGRRRLEAFRAKDVRGYINAVIETEEYEDLLPLWEIARSFVVEILRDPTRDLSVRRRALDLVSITRTREAGPALATLLTEERQPLEFLIEAAVATGRCSAEAAVEPLIALLNHEDPALQAAATTSLGQIGSPQALHPLLGKWSDRGGALRTSIRLAARRLGTDIGADALAGLLRRQQRWQPAEIYFITDDLQLTEGYREGVLDGALSSAAVEARRDAILLMAYLAGSGEAEKLTPLRDDQDPEIRSLAALALERVGRP